MTDSAIAKLLIVQRMTGEPANASRKLSRETLSGIHCGGRVMIEVGGFRAVEIIQ